MKWLYEIVGLIFMILRLRTKNAKTRADIINEFLSCVDIIVMVIKKFSILSCRNSFCQIIRSLIQYEDKRKNVKTIPEICRFYQ